ncbi:MAG: ABC exporter membrane fusion protein [Gloeomargarita sp. SKYBB_i_bin120]|nr:ABC exporter membrane fusion protein [Gloeomargarita sp. SKYG98]MCS7292297.1 ABC exporter membrane fusion protein [Gloeomargarita sp. SKYB120]MDW8177857.1 ABC exporter membrane fusion protein [Gloeomargarita sp. SKYBB_i_bin120]
MAVKFPAKVTAGKGKRLPLLVGVGALGVLLVLGYGQYRRAVTRTSKLPAATTPVSRPMVAALGRIQPEGEVITLSAPSSIEGARLAELRVKEGDRVQAGQVLATLDTTRKRQVEMQLAASQVAIAQARLQQVLAGAKAGDLQAQRAEIARLEAELQLAQTDLRRNQQLFQEGAIAAADLDRFRLRVQTLQKQLQQAQGVLRSLQEVRAVDVQLAQAQLAEARQRLALARVEWDLSLIRAPVAGRVLKIHARVGETIGSAGILDLGRTDRMFVVAEVYETDVSRVRPGQRAVVTTPAIAQPLRGTVTDVGWKVAKKDVLNTDPVADVDARVVEVKIALDPAAAPQVQRLTNMVVNVRIEL